MKQSKVLARQQRRTKSYENSKTTTRKDACHERDIRWTTGGYHEPGSRKKPHPVGRRSR